MQGELPMASSKQIRIFLLGLFALTAGWLCVIAAHADSADPAAGFRRGIGISHAMAWARIEAGPSPAFAFPPFSDPWNALTLDELQTLRQSGFDFVRLAVDPGPFLQFQGPRRDALDGILMDRVRLILAAGLSVIVDFHPSDLHPDYTAQALTAGLHRPLYQAYLRMLARTAGLLDELHSRKIALELMNEPPLHPDAWQPMLEAAYAAVRRRSADLPVVLDGGDATWMGGMKAIARDAFARDRAVIYTFHYYDPYQFTHQGAPWWDAARYLADVPYPALARPLQDSLDATAAAIIASDLPQPQKILSYQDAQLRLQSYRRSGFDRSTIANAFDRITDWARAQDLPPAHILLGEFGARETALQLYGRRAAERARWFHDVSEEAAAHGFGWAVWAYRGDGGFALARGETDNSIEPDIARALGLIPRARADAAPDDLNVTAQAKPQPDHATAP